MRIQELTLYGIDLEELQRFYCAVLGMREIEPYWTGRLMVQAGETRLAFVSATQEVKPRYHFAFDVHPDRLEEAVRWLRERGGLLTSKDGESRFHSEMWNADNVYFSDPEGNILELIARHTLALENATSRSQADDERRRLANRPFSVLEIVAVTEIGLATDTVVDTVGALIERMPGLKTYSGEGSDTFTAVGDVHGLFIIVRRGRIWFPDTGVPADFVPIEALVELENGARYRVSAPPFPFSALPAG